MKKSVLTLLAIATMVFGMSSCSQDNDGSSNDLNINRTTENTATQAQEQCDQYVMSFVLTGSNLTGDSTRVVKEQNISKTTMVVSESNAREMFNGKFEKMLPNMQEMVNGTATKRNCPDAIITCTLKNSKGQVVLQKTITPSK